MYNEPLYHARWKNSFVFKGLSKGQVWYLIVSIPDLCTLTYIVVKVRHIHLSASKLVQTEGSAHLITDGQRKQMTFIQKLGLKRKLIHIYMEPHCPIFKFLVIK